MNITCDLLYKEQGSKLSWPLSYLDKGESDELEEDRSERGTGGEPEIGKDLKA